MRLATILVPILSLSVVAVAGPLQPGRVEVPGLGSAIALEYSIEPGVLGPNYDGIVQLCLTNQNVHSTRSVQPGDAFSFEFGAGTVRGCRDVSVHSPDGTFLLDDFSCEALGPVVTLRFTGIRAVAWPPGDMACVNLRYNSATATGNVAASMEVGNRGAHAPASPAFVRIGIDRSLGVSSIGAVQYLTSSGVAHPQRP